MKFVCLVSVVPHCLTSISLRKNFFDFFIGGAVGGASPLNGLLGGNVGGLFGGTGGANDLFNFGSGGLLGGASAAPGGGLFGGGGGAEGGLLGGLFGGADGLLGGMGGLFGSSAGGSPGSRFGFGNRSSRQGEMLKTMLLMQMMGGADAPDPPATPTGRAGMRGRGRRPVSGPMAALEQLMRLEQINTIRQQQIERAMRNRMRPENQRSGRQGGRYPPGPGNFGPPTGSVRGAFGAPRRRNSPHPEALNRQNVQFPTTPAPGAQGQAPEPVEREQGTQGSGQPKSHGPRQRRQWTEATPTAGPDRQAPASQGPAFNDYPPVRPTPSAFNRAPQRPPMLRQQQAGMRQQGFPPSRRPARNHVPRNMRELMSDPRFQRRLRMNARPNPNANPADVRADRADRMADYMDNLQAMNPLARMMMGAGMPGIPGMAGMAGMGIPGMGGMGIPGIAGLGMPGMGGELMGLGGLLGLGGGALPVANALSGRGGMNSQMPTQRFSAQADMPGPEMSGGPGGVPVSGAMGEGRPSRARTA